MIPSTNTSWPAQTLNNQKTLGLKVASNLSYMILGKWEGAVDCWDCPFSNLLFDKFGEHAYSQNRNLQDNDCLGEFLGNLENKLNEHAEKGLTESLYGGFQAGSLSPIAAALPKESTIPVSKQIPTTVPTVSPTNLPTPIPAKFSRSSKGENAKRESGKSSGKVEHMDNQFNTNINISRDSKDSKTLERAKNAKSGKKRDADIIKDAFRSKGGMAPKSGMKDQGKKKLGCRLLCGYLKRSSTIN